MVKKIMKPEDLEAFSANPHTCGGKLERDRSGASSRVVEVLDNTWMPRAVERLADTERLIHDHVKGKK